MRIVKEAQERKNEILDCAVHLFAEKGYEKTTVTDIMNEVGIAKGTLYYHFKSKEDILDGIINRIFETGMTKAKAIVNDEQLDVHDKLLQALLSWQVREENSLQVLEEVHKPQNALMYQKMLQRILKDITPVLSEVIEEGVRQGVFHTEYPHDSAELFITYGNIVFDSGFIEYSKEDMSIKVMAFITNMERVLGMAKGELTYIRKMFE